MDLGLGRQSIVVWAESASEDASKGEVGGSA